MRAFFLCLSILILIVAGCQSDQNQDDSENGNNLPYHIDIEKGKAGDLLYSTFIEDIKYIRLETDPEHLVGEGAVYPCPDGFMINDHKNELTVFSETGKYLATIGKKGRGPDEYSHSNSPKIDFLQNRVYFKSNNSTIAWYSLEGHFIDKYDVTDLYHLGNFLYNEDKLYIAGIVRTHKDVYHPLGIYNDKGELKERISLELPEISSLNSSPSAILQMSADNRVLVSNIYPDTIHWINEGNQFSPYMILDLNGKGLKYEERFNIEQKRKRDGNSTSLRIMCDYGPILLFVLTINEESTLAYFNKHNSDFIILNGDWANLDRISWLVNDIDGGPGYPYFQCHNNHGYMLVQAFDLILLYESGKIDEALVKLPKRKKQLIELIKTLDENDNPIIMKVKFKKQ